MAEVAAGWYGDPSGRHVYRYWNGWSWTDDVADKDGVSTDPLHPPMPATSEASTAGANATAAAISVAARASDASPLSDDDPNDRQTAIERAVATWTGQLIDLGGRNSLLYFRDLRVGTLDLEGAQELERENFLEGRTVPLSRLFSDQETLAQQARRCRALRSKAKENFEERGLRTLFVGAGIATWSNPRGTATPAAPVLLRSLTLTPRGGAEEDFDLSLGEDWDINPTLVHLLKTEFNIACDPEDLLSAAFDAQGHLDLLTTLELLTKTAADAPGFTCNERVVIANFSYAKMPMVVDLESSVDALANHPLVCALAGSTADRTSLRSGQELIAADVDKALPDRLPPSLEYLVLDADASQSQAINLATRGANLVIQGPPGTGKSQTIANLITSLVAEGKTVLFVAEKRAAIDAVLNRLDRRGLGDLVLDLHGGTGSRKQLAAQLGRALATMSQTPAVDQTALQQRLTTRRTELNDHVKRLHATRSPWQASVYELQALALATPAQHALGVQLDRATLERLDPDTLRRAADELTEWIALGGTRVLLMPTGWARAAGHVRTPEQVIAARACADHLRSEAGPHAGAQIAALVSAAHLRFPESLGECAALLELLQSVEQTASVFEQSVYGDDLDSLIDQLAPVDKSPIGRLFNSTYRKARKQAGTHCRRKLKSRALRDALAIARSELARWSAFATDGGVPRPSEQLGAAAGSFAQLQTELAALGAWMGGPFRDEASLEDLKHELDELAADDITLTRLPRIEELRDALQAAGLGPLLDEVARRALAPDAALDALTFAWSNSILTLVRSSDPGIAAFSGDNHSRLAREFCDADSAHIESTVARLRRRLAESGVAARNTYPDQSDVLEHNSRLKTRHRSIRDLLQMAPDVLLAIRPCWVMSPLVVAQLLPNDRPYFDVVVFDEASQVRPADAIPALARGRQAVVAGDSKQLPPTAFFNVTATSSDDEDDEQVAGIRFTDDMESILDAMSALLPPPHGTTTLDWHYRSLDERLIAFSNAQPDLYDSALTTFPGSVGEGCLRHVLIPHRPGIGGTVDSSTDEVEQVVQLVAEHAATRPTESLGVIAMGIKHADRIQESLRLLRRDDRALDEFMNEASEEAFFVKNLERVQGDERDAIILTIGYPKTGDGRMQYRFGPLNQDGGARRLNVAITRARRRMTVVSAFGPEDMDDDRLSSDGAKMLKRYLAYTASGGTDLGAHAMAKPALNGFELDVKNRLSTAGIPLIAQYGVAGYWIDFAAKHPTRPGEMVLAIEADGATYHSSETARQRDRLRQSHLERLGWRFHRIWSLDWFRDPDVEVARVRMAYDRAIADADAAKSAEPRVGTEVRRSPALAAAKEPTVIRRGSPPFIPHGLPIDEYSTDQLDTLLRWIKSDTLLRTDDELLQEMMKQLGYARRGARIVAAIESCIRRNR